MRELGEDRLLDKPTPTRFDEDVVLDQIRTVDQERLVKRLGSLSPPVLGQALAVLREMFAG